jgi:hypothetical protein
MAANSTRADYDAKTAEWSRARDVLVGEDAGSSLVLSVSTWLKSATSVRSVTEYWWEE